MSSDRRGSLRTHVRITTSKSAPGGISMVELNLTKRQQEIFDFVKRYVGEHGYPPTVRDIGKAIGLTSSSTVHAHLGNLERLAAAARPDQATRDGSAGRQGAPVDQAAWTAGRRPGGRRVAGARGGEH